jgi:ribosomal protein S18 acetylase RimI-like enzyme
MEIKLLKATENELLKIAEFAEVIWKQYYTEIITLSQIEYMLKKFYSKEALEEQIKLGQEFYFIRNQSETLGFISYSLQTDSVYFIHKFYILPNQHRQNLGSIAMQEIEKEIIDSKKNKNYKLKLTVNRKNFKAINFYFKNGYIIESVEDFDIGESYLMNDFVMVKNAINGK